MSAQVSSAVTWTSTRTHAVLFMWPTRKEVENLLWRAW